MKDVKNTCLFIQKNVCIPETKLLYLITKGMQSPKQSIHGKLIKFGWTQAMHTCNDYVIQFEPYTGAASSNSNLEFRPSVLKLIESLPDCHFLYIRLFLPKFPIDWGKTEFKKCYVFMMWKFQNSLEDHKTWMGLSGCINTTDSIFKDATVLRFSFMF